MADPQWISPNAKILPKDPYREYTQDFPFREGLLWKILGKVGFNENDIEATKSAVGLLPGTGLGVGPANPSSVGQMPLMPEYGMKNPRYKRLFNKLFSTKENPTPVSPEIANMDILMELLGFRSNPHDKPALPGGGNRYVRHQSALPQYESDSPAIPRVKSNIAYYGDPEFARMFTRNPERPIDPNIDWPGGIYSVQRRLSDLPGAVVVPSAPIANKHAYLEKLVGAKQAAEISQLADTAHSIPTQANLNALKDFLVNRKHLTPNEINTVFEQGPTHFPEYLKDKIIEKWMNKTGTRALVVQRPKKIGAELIERVDRPGVPVKLEIGRQKVTLDNRYKRRVGDLKNWISNQKAVGMEDYQIVEMLREQGFIE